jgi:uncharacterized protein YrrD
MIRGRDILRLPVISRDMGKKVGQVEDFVIDRQGIRVLGVVVDEGGIFSDARVVPWPSVLAVGFDGVIIDSESSVVKASDVSEIHEVLERGFVLHGSRVETTAGRELGVIENFFFDSATGALQGFELIGGLNAQQPSGSAFLPAQAGFEAGKEYNFVDPSAADTLEDLQAALKARTD